jgi:predicted Zn-dependent protease with MMP-like domain
VRVSGTGRGCGSEGVAAQSFSPSVDGFGGSDEGVVVEEGKDVDTAAPQGAELGDLLQLEKPPLSQRRLWHRSGDGCAFGTDLDDPFEEAIDEALSSLPADFHAAISNVAILVEDEPPGGRPLLGLYQGVPLAPRGVFLGSSGMLPAKVRIFRGPITRLAAGDADRLRREVRHVVLHELAHYFGIK